MSDCRQYCICGCTWAGVDQDDPRLPPPVGGELDAPPGAAVTHFTFKEYDIARGDPGEDFLLSERWMVGTPRTQYACLEKISGEGCCWVPTGYFEVDWEGRSYIKGFDTWIDISGSSAFRWTTDGGGNCIWQQEVLALAPGDTVTYTCSSMSAAAERESGNKNFELEFSVSGASACEPCPGKNYFPC